jgi:hypothetical protein
VYLLGYVKLMSLATRHGASPLLEIGCSRDREQRVPHCPVRAARRADEPLGPWIPVADDESRNSGEAIL